MKKMNSSDIILLAPNRNPNGGISSVIPSQLKNKIADSNNEKNQRYYLVNFNGDLIKDNLTFEQAEKYIKRYKKEKLYIQKELDFE